MIHSEPLSCEHKTTVTFTVAHLSPSQVICGSSEQNRQKLTFAIMAAF